MFEQVSQSRSADKPRYQLDLMNPIVNQIATEMDKSNFDIKVIPAHLGSKKLAQTIMGIIRHTENVSDAGYVYQSAGRNTVESGLSGWRVDLEYTNPRNFDQDLRITFIPNFKDRVWFDPGALDQSKDTANWCVVLTPMLRCDYDEEFPEGSGISVGQDRSIDYYHYQNEYIVTGEYFYKKTEKVGLTLMSNGHIVEKNSSYQYTLDEYKKYGVTPSRS